MNVYRDEATGYLILDDISDGIDILPHELYQSYLKQIKDLTEQNRDLQSRLNDMGAALSSHVQNEKSVIDMVRSTAESERAVGIAIGTLCAKTGHNYRLAKLYWKEYEYWYENVCDDGTIEAIEAKYERELALEDAKYEIGQNE